MTPPASDHFNGKTFFQPGAHPERGFRDVLKWRLTAQSARWPTRVDLPTVLPPPPPTDDRFVITWLGHATFLVQTTRGNVLFDPVFSERASPVTWAGPRRVHPVPIALEALPCVDAVCLSHDHYDHCDLPTLRWLATHTEARFIAPLRNGELLVAAGAKTTVELDWWQTHAALPGVEITLTPTKHWSKRFSTPRNHRLWGGFMLKFSIFDSRFSMLKSNGELPSSSDGPAQGKIENPPRLLWFVGDTGYDQGLFRAVRTCCGTPDVALVPIGAYEPRWFMAPMHMNPAEAVRLHQDVGAKMSIGMHWGTFQLTDEGREAPSHALAAARREAGISEDAFRTLDPGQSVIA